MAESEPLGAGWEAKVAFREVHMLEVKEVVRLWLSGQCRKAIARQLGRDIKTVRRYVRLAEAEGLRPGGELELNEAMLGRIVGATHGNGGREHGDGYKACETHREYIKELLRKSVRLSKVCRLLRRNNVEVSYATLRRFAIAELEWGEGQSSILVDDGKPGEELQVDVGRMLVLEPNALDARRVVKAFIFTPNVSRYRFIYPCFTETTADAIAACEAAWAFYGGVFKVLVPDNTKAIVQKADLYQPTLNEVFLEYAQSRGFHIDTARVRRPRDKGRVEKAVQDSRNDCFGGEKLATLPDCRTHAERYCRDVYGMRRHSTTRRMPAEHFTTTEKPELLSAPIDRYDVPIWGDAKVAPDQHAQILKALYSLPRRYKGKRVRFKADSATVRFYDGAEVFRVVERLPPGKRYSDPADFPPEQFALAKRDTAFLRRRAAELGPSIGEMAERMLDSPLPWTRMRWVYRLLRLCDKYGQQRLEAVCITALNAELTDVYKLERMLQLGAVNNEDAINNVIPMARYLRPQSHFAPQTKDEQQ